MKIVVCYKNVPDDESIKVNADKTLDFSAAALSIGQYDLNAMEAAALLADGDTEIIALTVAGDSLDNTKQRKAILSRGANRLVGVKDASLDSADAYTIAAALASAIEKIGGVDLVLFGEGSGDMYSQQTGPMTGEMLGWTNVNAVSCISREDNALFVTRSLETENETLKIALPAVVSVTADINKPRIPSMKDILGAGKKPVEIMDISELEVEAVDGTRTANILAPEQTRRKKLVFEGVTEKALDQVATVIKKLM